jgi:hypothetical protein
VFALLTDTTAMLFAVIQFAVKRLLAFRANFFFSKNYVCLKVVLIAVPAISKVFTPIF